MINFVDKIPVKEFSAINSNGGVILCEKQSGAFITLKYSEDVENLKKLINSITITYSIRSSHE